MAAMRPMSESSQQLQQQKGTHWKLVKSSCPSKRTNPQEEEESVAADLLVGTVAQWHSGTLDLLVW